MEKIEMYEEGELDPRQERMDLVQNAENPLLLLAQLLVQRRWWKTRLHRMPWFFFSNQQLLKTVFGIVLLALISLASLMAPPSSLVSHRSAMWMPKGFGGRDRYLLFHLVKIQKRI
uniref:Orf115a n=1 Tax=Batis maritima TaxID=4436 RepID=A0A068BD16_BATMA|nr:orf115a [Batis maritima]AIC83337.1 orf115a [Batis maritima]